MSCNTSKNNKVDKYDSPHVIRTDFTDNHKWKTICEQIVKPDKEYGFQAYVKFVDNEKFSNKTVEDLKLELSDISYERLFFFVVDSLTMNHKEKPILCVSNVLQDTIDRFRVIPEDMWIIENNLSTANLLFEEFLYSIDEDGIHRANMN